MVEAGVQEVVGCIQEMQALGTTHPEWFSSFEDSQSDLIDGKQTLVDLLATAPTELARGVVFGRILYLQQISALSNHPF